MMGVYVKEVEEEAAACWSDKTHPNQGHADAQGIAAHLVSLLPPQHRECLAYPGTKDSFAQRISDETACHEW